MRQNTDDEVELFTGVPRRGHVPMLRDPDLRLPKKKFL